MGVSLLSSVCVQFALDYGHSAGGLPDLTLWNPKTLKCKVGPIGLNHTSEWFCLQTCFKDFADIHISSVCIVYIVPHTQHTDTCTHTIHTCTHTCTHTTHVHTHNTRAHTQHTHTQYTHMHTLLCIRGMVTLQSRTHTLGMVQILLISFAHSLLK